MKKARFYLILSAMLSTMAFCQAQNCLLLPSEFEKDLVPIESFDRYLWKVYSDTNSKQLELLYVKISFKPRLMYAKIDSNLDYYCQVLSPDSVSRSFSGKFQGASDQFSLEIVDASLSVICVDNRTDLPIELFLIKREGKAFVVFSRFGRLFETLKNHREIFQPIIAQYEILCDLVDSLPEK